MSSLNTANRFIHTLFLKDSGFGFVNRTPIVAASIFVLATPWIVRNYNAFIDLEPGGLPHNIFGWIISTLLKPLGRETRSIEMYELDSNKESWLKDSGPLARKRRERPTLSWHSIPHRQLDQFPTTEVAASLARLFRQTVSDNSDLVEIDVSPHEKHGDGMMIHSSIETPHLVAKKSVREIGHIHFKKDNSLHVVLAPQDCKLVIEQGWGERHPLSGVMILPKEYLMLYAPNSEDEVQIIGKILRAAIGYMTDSRNVR